MKRPNFERWARREIERIRQDSSDLNIGDAYSRAARFAERLGDKYFKIGRTAKADHQYRIALRAYENLEDSTGQNKMLGKISRGGKVIHAVTLGLGIIFLLISLLLLSVRLTGNSILGLSDVSTSLTGAGFFIFSILSFYFYFR